jgi:hypothetical protein
MEDDEAFCANCVYSSPGPDTGFLECRRLPPVAVLMPPDDSYGRSYVTTKFPPVASFEWCWEHPVRQRNRKKREFERLTNLELED